MSTTSTLLFSIPVPGRPIPVYLFSLFGFLGQALFTARVLIQWIASERKKQTVVPMSFWWLSLFGTSIMVLYSYGQHEIPFILAYAAALVPYVRNLRIAYFPDRPPRRSVWIIGAAILLVGVPTLSLVDGESIQDPWLYFGLLANGIFASRFFVQWVQSEARRESVMPLSFWYLSLVGSVLVLIYSLVRNDAVFILAYVLNAIPYGRNIYLIHKRGRVAAARA